MANSVPVEEDVALTDAITTERRRRSILLYFLTLYLAVGVGSGGLMGIPLQFLLKDQLHLGPRGMATFHALLAIPVYFGFVFGFIRDRWSPFGLRDRGLLMIFGSLAAVGYVALSVGQVSYARLLVLMLLVAVCLRFVAAATNALTAIVGQESWMTGRLSTLLNVAGYGIGAVVTLASGFLTSYFSFREMLVIVAGLALLIFLMGAWRPATVFEGREKMPPLHRSGWSEVLRLLRHWEIWPAVIIWLLWQFTPAAFTPLFYFLTNQIHMNPAQYGASGFLLNLGFMITMLLYGFLCKRYSLRTILWWSTVFGVPQWAFVLLIHTPNEALWMMLLIGMLGGCATTAYFDLILRSCPFGLEGAAMLLADATLTLGVRGGDIWGSRLYHEGGYNLSALVTTGAYVLILPMLLLVPQRITRHRDRDVPVPR